MKRKLYLGMVSLFILGLFIMGNSSGTTHAAQTTTPQVYAAIDNYMAERMKALKIPGAAISIVQGDQIDYLKGYGIADSSGRAVTPQTPFLLASLSKSFTALAIMQLYEDHKLDLDAPVQKYLPWFQIADKKAAAEITLHELLYHTSGFSQVDGNRFLISSDFTDDSLINSLKHLKTTKLDRAPGVSYEYSTINYAVLGAVVESVSGQSYGSYIEQKIFTPLDMKHSYTSMSEARENGMARGYYPFFGIPIIYDQLMPYSPAVASHAGLFSSAEDMAHYMIAQLNDGHFENNVILSPEGVATLHTPGVMSDKWSGYAMGWGVGPDFDLFSRDQTNPLSGYTVPAVLSHGGSYIVFRSIVILIPEKKVGVLVLMNTDNRAIESAYDLVGWDIATLYLGKQPSYSPPYENSILQHIRSILIVTNIFLLASFIWFIRRLRNWRQQPGVSTPRWRRVFGYVVIPLAIDVLLVWFLLGVQLPQAQSTVWIALRGAPDIGLLIILVLLFSIGWGAIRTLLSLLLIFRKRLIT